MKTKFLFITILVAGLIAVNFSVQQAFSQATQNKPVMQHSIKYICTEHPEEVQNHPGTCSICGMVLVDENQMNKGTIYQLKDSAKMKNDSGKMRNTSIPMQSMQRRNDTNKMKMVQMNTDSLRMKSLPMKYDTARMKKQILRK